MLTLDRFIGIQNIVYLLEALSSTPNTGKANNLFKEKLAIIVS
jgi:hypothetical protein